MRGMLLEEMRAFPVLHSPECTVPAFNHEERAWSVEGPQVAYPDPMRYRQWSNLLAAPAVVVPVGRSPEGLPIGVQIAGRPYENEIVLAIAATIERDFGFCPRH